MEKRQRTRLASLAVLVVVFGAGLLLGMAWDVGLNATPAADTVAEEVAEARGDEEREGSRDRERGEPLYRQVGELDPAQEAAIDSVVADYRRSMKELHEEFESEYEPALEELKAGYRARFEPRYSAIIEEARAAIQEVLTPQQAARYDSLVTDFDRRREERRREQDGPDHNPD